LYAGTDFGPLVLRRDSNHWAAAGVGFPEALMVDLEIDSARRVLVGATHGIGVFYLDLTVQTGHNGARVRGSEGARAAWFLRRPR
jgi:hypothetical protein